jgi:aminoglycoside 2'-N-acetyltransferase I
MDGRTLRAARALLWDVFGADMTEHDWDHCLGGTHALVWDRGELIGHGSVIERLLRHAGRTLKTGYIEGLGVRADRRGQGHGASIMASLEGIVRRDYELGALGATEQAEGFYAARGWKLWEGPSSAVTPRGVEKTPEDDGGIFVLEVSVPIDTRGELTCDWRAGDLW